eukprot:876600-Rhodomonas_salina.2
MLSLGSRIPNNNFTKGCGVAQAAQQRRRRNAQRVGSVGDAARRGGQGVEGKAWMETGPRGACGKTSEKKMPVEA